jgi:hypothetical protein
MGQDDDDDDDDDDDGPTVLVNINMVPLVTTNNQPSRYYWHKIFPSSPHGICDIISCSRERPNVTSMPVLNHLSICTPQNSAGAGLFITIYYPLNDTPLKEQSDINRFNGRVVATSWRQEWPSKGSGKICSTPKPGVSVGTLKHQQAMTLENKPHI